jgi:glycerophosphoryl diester phosphodiesterase
MILAGAGTNHLNGGAGSDIFRIVSELGDLPAAKQVVMDFTVGEDKIGLRGVQFADLSFSQSGTDAVLTYGNNTIGQFSNMTAAALNNQANFTFG